VQFVYLIYGHWVWGGGWLSKLPFGMGHLDFAGSGVVHTIGGMFALGAAIVLGPRFGKFGKNGTPNAIPGHSITLAALGVFILWFGWFGFNPGSTFNAHHLRISVIAVNTNLAAAGGFAALLIVFLKTKKYDVGMALNGVLAGLVAVTAPFATGLLYGGGSAQFIAQVIVAGVAAFWALACGYILFKIMNAVMGIRVSPQEEVKGLDVYEHGGSAYPDFYTQSK